MEIYRQITANNLPIKDYPFLKELAMEAYLLENEEILKLDRDNFNDVIILDEEIALKEGRKSGDGRIDILAKYSGEYLGIVELKIGEINDDALGQLQQYLDQRKQILGIDAGYWNETTPPKWVGVLVGSSISSALQEKLVNGYEYEGIPIAALTIRRFRHGSEIYVISDTYFRYKYSNKDFSKFQFLGQSYNKGRLVNSVVRSYVDSNVNVTFAKLKEAFPDTLQGTFGVFSLKETAEEIFQRTGHKRFYINPDEIIRLHDGTEISTCTQWSIHNIKLFIEHIGKMGITVKIL